MPRVNSIGDEGLAWKPKRSVLEGALGSNLGVDYPKEDIESARGIGKYSLSILLSITYERESRV